MYVHLKIYIYEQEQKNEKGGEGGRREEGVGGEYAHKRKGEVYP